MIVVAAGSGLRLGARMPKAFVPLDDRTMLRHALDPVARIAPAQVVVVAPAGREADAAADARAVLDGDRAGRVSVVAGAATRQGSVAAGVAALDPAVNVVLVHDAARALTPVEVFERVIAAVSDGAAGAIPVTPVVDTNKRVEQGVIIAAVDRAELSAAQTPQGFRRDVLDDVYRDTDVPHRPIRRLRERPPAPYDATR